MDAEPINLPFDVAQEVIKRHGNLRGLDPDQFINVKDLEQNPY